ncbi:putative cysteine-rich receptor-like protein kinase 33 [Cardamine amara subsp. amara]|uniref:Cysteine-rich receptor-like protein kinase 33 n=1 Tax=Cardamine amara subsp. amara TaxID=228776 RepID=A0ABD1BHL8_CARAN
MRIANNISLSILLFVVVSINVVVSSPQCIDTGFFYPNSNYGPNRHKILSSFPSDVMARKGFYNASVGQDSDEIYAMGMCITENEPKVCSDCIKTASDELQQNCPNQMEAYTWRPAHKTLCFVRYSNRSFSGKLDPHPLYTEHNTGDIKSNLTALKSIWDELTVV